MGSSERAPRLREDADGFGILELEGAVRMRQWGCRQPILLLEGFFQENELAVIAEQGLRPSSIRMNSCACLKW
jgi:alanine racemase